MNKQVITAAAAAIALTAALDANAVMVVGDANTTTVVTPTTTTITATNNATLTVTEPGEIEILLVGGEFAVDRIVGAHDRGRLGLPDRSFEAGEIDLSQAALVHH